MATLTELQNELTLYKDAEKKILLAQEYSGLSGGMTVKRADLATIQKKITELEHRIAILGNGTRLPSFGIEFRGER